ncbi:hypothetical protein GX586_14520 [bacterium]|nr:hypothetical protein [bacterium]
MEKLNRHRPLFGSLLFYGGILACMMPALAALLFVYSSGVNIPFADEWHFVADHYDKWCNGTLTISDLFSQHNEHRIAFARLLMLVTGGLTHYNGVAILYVIQMLFVLVALVFLAAFRDRFGGKPRAFVACAFVPISFMVFQLRQWENMILPIQTQTMLATSGSLAAFLLLSRFVRNGKATHGLLALALLAACVASFSQMMGLFVWPSALVVFLCGARRRKLLYAAVWAVAGCLVWLAYFHHFKKPWQTPDPLGMLHNPRQFAEYLSACLGGSLFWTVGAATTAGVVIAVLLIGAALLVCVRRRWQENTFWIAAAAFSLIVVAVISTGRCGFGVDQALSSRYSAFSLLLLPAVYAVLLDSACEWRSRVGMGLIVILTGLLFWSAMPSYTNGFAEGRNFRLRQEQNAFYLTAFDDIP